MILGLGTDIIEVARIQNSLDKFGDHFLRRILTAPEIAYCQNYRTPALHVAARFAAKEAVAKAFGTGIGADLGWLDMEVRRAESGAPFVELSGKGRELFQVRGAARLLLTLSHTANHAVAVAILEG
jgi:holo-[acyl-carrier protein] synthase